MDDEAPAVSLGNRGIAAMGTEEADSDAEQDLFLLNTSTTSFLGETIGFV